MKSKEDFVEHCVLIDHTTPVEAMRLWKETLQVLADDWKPDLNASGAFLQGLFNLLDATSCGTRRTVHALMEERYPELRVKR